MSDETTPEASSSETTMPRESAVPTGSSTSAADAPTTGSTSTNGDAGTEGAGVDGPPKRRRRRGSRGGRNRRRGGGGGGGSGGGDSGAPGAGGSRPVRSGGSRDSADDAIDAEAISDDAVRNDALNTGDDYTDAAADRGLTSDDIAADAKEEAGLVEGAPPDAVLSEAPEPPTLADAKPKIGDTRPGSKPQIGDTRAAPTAPAADGATKSTGRRRRRGGRGRSRGGAGGGTGGNGGGRSGGASTSSATPRVDDDVVYADLGVGETVSMEELDDETLARRRGRTRKGRPAGRYMMAVHRRPNGHTHIALLEGRSLIEHSVSAPSDDDTSIDGNIYLGRVQNVLPGMEAAFIDIGTPKNGVLYRGDVSFDADEVEEKQPKIERLLKNGQSVIVQVTKNPIGAKGARLTQEVSLAGRFVVMVPNQPNTYGISKRLPDDERRRLRRILEGLRPPDAGLIVRTAAEGATADELERDVRRLAEQWAQISALAGRSKPARLLYQEPALALRLLREEFTKEYRGVVIDDRELYEEVHAYVSAVTPELAERVEYYDTEAEGLPVFERFHVNEQLLKALDRKVWLPSGGSLVIERTEALTVIDVNTGKNVGRSNLEETVFRNNLEAAEEVARQLRLRDIGGIIVIDFIDMEIKGNRSQVQKAFRDALARDKTRTQVFDISELGLVEMTRKRVSEGLIESVSSTCSTCQGRGYLLEEALLEELQ